MPDGLPCNDVYTKYKTAATIVSLKLAEANKLNGVFELSMAS